MLKLPCQNVCATYGTYNIWDRTDTSQGSPVRCRDKPLSADVPMPLPRHRRTTRGNTVLSGFFEQMGRVGEKGKKWWLARESLGGTRERNALWGEAREWCLLAFDLWSHPILELAGWRWLQVSLFLRPKSSAYVTCQGQGSRTAANLSCPLPSCRCPCFHRSLICHFIFFSFFSCLKVTIISSVCFPAFLFLLLLYFLSYFTFSLFLSFLLTFLFVCLLNKKSK